MTPPPNGPGNGYLPGTKVTAEAIPGPDNDLLAWGGACSGTIQTSNCTLTIDSDKNITATFIKLPNVTVNGQRVTGSSVSLTNATISVDPAPNASASSYRAGTRVTLKALTGLGYVVSSWTGACAGTTSDTCVLVTDGDKSTNVSFGPVLLMLNGTQVETTLNFVQNGSVTVQPPPDIPSAQGGLYTPGTQVTITAQANAGSTFKQWTGACAGQPAQCKLTMKGAAVIAVELGP